MHTRYTISQCARQQELCDSLEFIRPASCRCRCCCVVDVIVLLLTSNFVVWSTPNSTHFQPLGKDGLLHGHNVFVFLKVRSHAQSFPSGRYPSSTHTILPYSKTSPARLPSIMLDGVVCRHLSDFGVHEAPWARTHSVSIRVALIQPTECHPHILLPAHL